MDWQMPTGESDLSPHANQGLQLAMLAQEAISNALRHAQCKVLRIRLTCHEATWQLEIADDGCGYQPSLHDDNSQECAGRGLQSMRTRAQQACAVLSIDAQAGRGTHVGVQWSAVR